MVQFFAVPSKVTVVDDNLFQNEPDFDTQDGENLFEQDGPDLFGMETSIDDFSDAGSVDDGEFEQNEESVVSDNESSSIPKYSSPELQASNRSESTDSSAVEFQPTADGLQSTNSTLVIEQPLALYRRYRPDTFDHLIGQEHVTEPLKRALDNNKVAHAYLFSGPRGCGKTSSARILARCLNCEQGPTSTPCGQCRSCRDLATGGPGSIDVIEIDAASHGGVDDARDLRERAFFAPVQSRFKVYIIDEAHMVTSHGFNALLKVIEEPPPHVKFVFATTEPDKVLGTIRSRTHHYPFRLVPPKVMGSFLTEICELEEVGVEPSVIPLAVRAGGGSVRDSLSVLDQLIGGAGTDGVTYGQASSLLGFTPDLLLDEVMDAFASGDATGVFESVDKVIEIGQDPKRFTQDLLDRFRDLVIVSAVPTAISSGLISVPEDRADRLASQATALGQGALTRAAQIVAEGLDAMRGTTAPRLILELLCSRILLPGADLDEKGIYARLDQIERRLELSVTSTRPAEHRLETSADSRSKMVVSTANDQAEPVAATSGQSELSQQGSASDESAQKTTPVSEPTSPPSRRSEQIPRTSQPAEQTGQLPKMQRPASKRPARPGLRPVSVAQSEVAQSESAQSESAQSGSGQLEMSQINAAPTPQSSTSAPQLAASGSQTQAQPEPVTQPQPAVSKPSSPTPDVSSPSSDVPSRSGIEELHRMWPDVLENAKKRSRLTYILLNQNAQIKSLSGDTLTLVFDSQGALNSFGGNRSMDVLTESLAEVMGLRVRVALTLEGETEQDQQNRGPAAESVGESFISPSQNTTAEVEEQSFENSTSGNGNFGQSSTRNRSAGYSPVEPDEYIDDVEDYLDPENAIDVSDPDETATELLMREFGAEPIDEEQL